MDIALERIRHYKNQELDLSDLGLTCLPKLPNDLLTLRVDRNELTSLSCLPKGLFRLECAYNKLTFISDFPSSLEYICCDHNQLTALPELPEHLHTLFCDDNPLETLPELPCTLVNLLSRGSIYTPLLELFYMHPTTILHINAELRKWPRVFNQESKKRCIERCLLYKEEIMMKAWHPSRVEKLLEMGYDHEDM